MVFFSFSGGSINLISSHKQSGILLTVGTYMALSQVTIMRKMASSYMPIYFWDRF